MAHFVVGHFTKWNLVPIASNYNVTPITRKIALKLASLSNLVSICCPNSIQMFLIQTDGVPQIHTTWCKTSTFSDFWKPSIATWLKSNETSPHLENWLILSYLSCDGLQFSIKFKYKNSPPVFWFALRNRQYSQYRQVFVSRQRMMTTACALGMDWESACDCQHDYAEASRWPNHHRPEVHRVHGKRG